MSSVCDEIGDVVSGTDAGPWLLEDLEGAVSLEPIARAEAMPVRRRRGVEPLIECAHLAGSICCSCWLLARERQRRGPRTSRVHQ